MNSTTIVFFTFSYDDVVVIYFSCFYRVVQVFGLDVYINPRVASLPQHQHLFGGNGCHKDVMDNRDGGYACTGIDALPKNFESLLDCRKILPTDIQRQNVLWYKLPWVCNPNARFKN